MRYRDAMHRPLGLACALLSACGPSPGEESTTEAPARTTGAAASTGEPTTTTTIDTPTTTGDSTPTSTTSTGPTPTTSPDDDTSTGGTTGAPGQCGPPCDAPWIHEGDLEINAKTDPESLRCLVEVWPMFLTRATSAYGKLSQIGKIAAVTSGAENSPCGCTFWR